jgi:16S rRNA (guanine527-N7)-methyltransferase
MTPDLLLRSICNKNFFEINEQHLYKLKRYVARLLMWNQKVNLISRQDKKNIWTQHILASISFLFRFEIEKQSSVVDLGTGGGLPGIPISILRPDLRLVLIDSIQKKVRAIQDIIKDLELNNVTTLCGRAEELNRKKHLQNKFDYVVARAVSSSKDVLLWSKPFLKTDKKDPQAIVVSENNRKLIPRGSIILLKGGDINREIDETRAQHNPKSIQAFPIVINGIDPAQLFDKKIIIIQA